MKKLLFVLVLPIALSACTFGQKVTNTASEAKQDAGTFVNKATGVTDTAILKAADIAFATTGRKSSTMPSRSKVKKLPMKPCLSENLTTGWVADLVHNPRIAEDDFPQNICQNFKNGTAKHFVEIDLSGNFVRAQ